MRISQNLVQIRLQSEFVQHQLKWNAWKVSTQSYPMGKAFPQKYYWIQPARTLTPMDKLRNTTVLPGRLWMLMVNLEKFQ